MARCYYNHAVSLAQAGRHEEALLQLERAVPHFERLVQVAPNEPSFADLRRQAAQQLDWMRANMPAELAARLLAEVEGLAAPARAAGNWQALRKLGESLMKRTAEFRDANRPVEMERVYRAAAGLVGEAARLDPTPDSAHLEAALVFDLNIDLRELGRYDGAEEAVRGAIRRWAALHARYPDDRRFRHWLAGARNNLGIIRADTGRLHAAEEAYRAALVMREEEARANPADAENQLFHGGALCNLGNVHLARGELAIARDYYERAVVLIEPTREKLPGNQLVAQFLTNCRDGLRACETHTPVDPGFIASATVGRAPPGPPALSFDAVAELSEELRAADALRLTGDPAAAERTAELVVRFPDSADAWLLRGLVLGDFCTEQGGGTVTWQDERHEEATAAFYECLVLRRTTT